MCCSSSFILHAFSFVCVLLAASVEVLTSEISTIQKVPKPKKRKTSNATKPSHKTKEEYYTHPIS